MTGYFDQIETELWSLDGLAEWCALNVSCDKKRILDSMKKRIQDVRDKPVSEYAKLKADDMFKNLEGSINLLLVLNYWHISGLLVGWVLNCWFAVV